MHAALISIQIFVHSNTGNPDSYFHNFHNYISKFCPAGKIKGMPVIDSGPSKSEMLECNK